MSRADVKAHFVHIEGVRLRVLEASTETDIALKLPVAYRWQDLKDLARDAGASRGVWAEMSQDPNGQPSSKGYIRLLRENEALTLYSKYVMRSLF